MPLKFQIRSNSLDAWYSTVQKGHGAGEGTVAIVSSAISGVFGGQLIDFATGAPAALRYEGGNNWVGGSVNGAFTMLCRMVPTWTGVPGTAQSLFQVGDMSGLFYGGFRCLFSSGGTVQIQGHNDDGTTWYGDQLYGSPTAFPPFVANQPIDIWVRWAGGSNDNIELWTADPGVVPTQINTGNGNSYIAGTPHNQFVSMAMGLGTNLTGGATGQSSDYYINEFVLWDEFIDPTSFGARSDFIPAPNFEGALSTNPGESNVLSGVSYIDHGVGQTGTLVVPGASTDPGVGNVRLGTDYEIDGTPLVGTLVVPGASTDPGVGNVLDGVDYEIDGVAKVGTFEPPVSTDPGITNVRQGVTYEINNVGKTGTEVNTDPGVGNVRSGADYEINNVPKVGTLVVPGASTDPGQANVLDGVDYEINGVNKTGSLVSTDPGVGNVSDGVDYEINNVPLVGTRTDVTNEFFAATLTGQNLNAVLKGE